MEVARAASLAIIGPGALVTSSHQLWFLSGGRYWHDYTEDVVAGRAHMDPREYFKQFDAVADLPSWLADFATLRQVPAYKVVPALYAEGQLQLRGFYSDAFPFALFTSRSDQPLRGFVRRGDRLFDFRAEAGGRDLLVTEICPANAPNTFEERIDTLPGRSMLQIDIADIFAPLPPYSPAGNLPLPDSTPLERIRGYVLPADEFPVDPSGVTDACRVRDRVEGTLTEENADDFGRRLTAAEREVSSYWELGDALAARQPQPAR
jgi:hypothetical protein